MTFFFFTNLIENMSVLIFSILTILLCTIPLKRKAVSTRIFLDLSPNLLQLPPSTYTVLLLNTLAAGRWSDRMSVHLFWFSENGPFDCPANQSASSIVSSPCPRPRPSRWSSRARYLSVSLTHLHSHVGKLGLARTVHCTNNVMVTLRCALFWAFPFRTVPTAHNE